MRKLKIFIESNFQDSGCERVCSWANSGPIPFRPGRSLYGITSTYYLISLVQMLRGSIFIPVINNMCTPCTLQVQTLMDCTSITLTNRSYKTLAYISSIPYTGWVWRVHSNQLYLVSPFLVSQLRMLNCTPCNLMWPLWNLIYLTNLIRYSINSLNKNDVFFVVIL